MEMRAGEEVEIGSDVTPALSPISYALHDSFLSSHCSSCFSPLPDPPFLPTSDRNLSSTSVFYCSELCSSVDSSLHFSSGEFHLHSSSTSSSSADLRSALRLLRSACFSPSNDRMSGLLTNREKILADDDEISDRVRTGARVMAAARREKTRDGAGLILIEEEAALCLVITNGVEVLDSRSRSIGIAVYDSTFSWINHSCSPNSCYRFIFSPPAESPDSAPRIVPSGSGVDNDAAGGRMRNFGGGYGPRIVVRSIRRIEKGEEVTVAYTDLLQPKAVRKSELWLKYRFICICARCCSSSSPSSYVDHAVEDISSSSSQLFDAARANEILTDYVDEAITTFLLSEGDNPEPCCAQLERLLIAGLDQPDMILRLHPLHHLSLNAYTTLASAYSIRASIHEAFNESRTSAAYSFFLAAAANRLFDFEPSLIVSVSNYWASAGEALLRLVSISSTTNAATTSLAERHRCSKCRFMDVGLAIATANADFTSISFELVGCIRSYARKVWWFLSNGCQFLAQFNDPMDFDLIQKPVSTPCDRTQGFGFMDREIRTDVWQLGAHCLVYGGFLSTVCYGRDHSPWTDKIRKFLT